MKYLDFYVTFDELKKGGRDCNVSKERPSGLYVKVLTDSQAYAYRGCSYVFFKDIELSSQILSSSQYGGFDVNGPTVGLLDDALKKAKEIGLIK